MNKQENVPALRFPEFTGNLKIKELGDLLEFKNGINASKEQYGTGVKFINVLDILNNEFITHEKIIGSVDVDETTVNKYPVNYGDILFQRSSETREDVGSACVYLDKQHTATFGGFVIRGRKIGEYDPIFLNKLLKTDSARDNITSRSGGSTRYNVGQETLSSIALYFPSLPEQQKIATFLSSVDEKLQGLKKKKSLLEAYKKGMMQRLFSSEPGLTRLEDEQDLDDNNPTILTSRKLRFRQDNGEDFPDWEEKTLGEVSENVMYGMNSSAIPFDGHNKYLRITDIDDNSRTFKPNPLTSPDGEIEDKYKLNDGDIVFTRTGASVGKSYLYNYKDGNLLFAGFLIKFSIRNNNPYFIFSQTLLNSYNKWVQLMSMRSGQPGINAEEYKSFTLQIPSLPEQTKIANFLSAIDEKIAKVSEEIEQATVWKKGLLQQLFV